MRWLRLFEGHILAQQLFLRDSGEVPLDVYVRSLHIDIADNETFFSAAGLDAAVTLVPFAFRLFWLDKPSASNRVWREPR